MTEKYTTGLIVKKHTTIRKDDADPIFRVVMKSLDKKTTLKLELPDLGRQIFQNYPRGEVIEISLQEPSQSTLDTFDENEEDDD